MPCREGNFILGNLMHVKTSMKLILYPFSGVQITKLTSQKGRKWIARSHAGLLGLYVLPRVVKLTGTDAGP